ncbi:MAG: hypothetical protein ACOH2H_13255 [Cypionkella sp.]
MPDFTDDMLARASVLVSRTFEIPIAAESLQAVGDETTSGLSTQGACGVRTYLSADRRRTIGLYIAPDIASVRRALRDANAAIEQAWAFRRFRS